MLCYHYSHKPNRNSMKIAKTYCLRMWRPRCPDRAQHDTWWRNINIKITRRRKFAAVTSKFKSTIRSSTLAMLAISHTADAGLGMETGGRACERWLFNAKALVVVEDLRQQRRDWVTWRRHAADADLAAWHCPHRLHRYTQSDMTRMMIDWVRLNVPPNTL